MTRMIALKIQTMDSERFTFDLNYGNTFQTMPFQRIEFASLQSVGDRYPTRSRLDDIILLYLDACLIA